MQKVIGFFFPRLTSSSSQGQTAPAEIVAGDALEQVQKYVQTAPDLPKSPSIPPPIPGFAPLLTATQDGNTTDIPVFQVFVLGTRGAGKTVFLSSLYNLLSVQDARNKFHLECDVESRIQLMDTYQCIANPHRGWPDGTSKTVEYVFSCIHRKAGSKPLELFKFRYFDFPGGYITSSTKPEEVKFILNQAKAAHSVLVLLDGLKIKNLLDNVPFVPAGRDDTSLWQDLDMMKDILQQCEGKPIHFAVTKADLLSKSKHSLSKIRELLMSHRGFRSFVSFQSIGGAVHLLPVSAVGAHFASIDPKTKQMIKNPNAHVSPFNVDLSLTFTIVDFLNQVATDLLKDLSDHSSANDVKSWIYTKATSFLEYSGFAASPLVMLGEHLFGLAAIANPITSVIVSGASQLGAGAALRAGGARLQAILSDLRAEIETSGQALKGKQTIIHEIIRIQIARAEQFTKDYPDSEIVADRGSQ
ncbi:hypothetical protein [Bradyrhizobium sp. BR 10289]|uniref:hypothetical protein n=1 Tax=Bradyrhizobium sp. BR 10289 TaxID=2749993 RepID=UPI001C652E2C|nr:hypothetical protein [Bradyrhizobium sp. BR 10289]MBW7968879.1 hypothetical protein [Bradyrhizobium sp. BR 10289]